MHAKLQTLVDKHQAKVSMSAILGDSIIGLDEEKKIVFFYKQVKEIAISNVIQLSEIRSCKMLNQSKSNKSKNENFNQFERLGLQFVAIDNNKPDTVLEFYNIEDSSYLNFDLKLLEQWSTLLSLKLK
jgi:hypothetical protein